MIKSLSFSLGLVSGKTRCILEKLFNADVAAYAFLAIFSWIDYCEVWDVHNVERGLHGIYVQVKKEECSYITTD